MAQMAKLKLPKKLDAQVQAKTDTTPAEGLSAH
jgi:hypothetical protein